MPSTPHSLHYAGRRGAEHVGHRKVHPAGGSTVFFVLLAFVWPATENFTWVSGIRAAGWPFPNTVWQKATSSTRLQLAMSFSGPVSAMKDAIGTQHPFFRIGMLTFERVWKDAWTEVFSPSRDTLRAPGSSTVELLLERTVIRPI